MFISSLQGGGTLTWGESWEWELERTGCGGEHMAHLLCGWLPFAAFSKRTSWLHLGALAAHLILAAPSLLSPVPACSSPSWVAAHHEKGKIPGELSEKLSAHLLLLICTSHSSLTTKGPRVRPPAVVAEHREDYIPWCW